jgi:redox-sensitive bicupin YhaK (pirin superfamily)
MTTRSRGLQKRVLGIRASTDAHWVGDGFPVRTLFSYHDSGKELSPFLLLDYAGPRQFSASGGGGKIGPGDVQWMTAASGIIHEEFHGREFARRGGMFEMVQLWVNLPARHKRSPPRYQSILAADIPVVGLGDGEARVIAGELDGKKGPAETFTPIHVWDLRVEREARFQVPDGFTTALVVLHGTLRVNGAAPAGAATFALLDPSGTEVHLESPQGARALLLSGEPIDEPIVGYGPFVMNTQQEIRQAIIDFQTGRMGQLA